MKNKIIVVYLANYKEKIYTLKRFLNYYKKYKSGVKHGLLICFKNFNENIPELKKWHKPLKKIKYLKFLDKFEIDDYDWGSYRRVAKKNKSKIILFLNSHSYPIVNNWLRIYTQNYKNNSLIGSSGSYCSLSSSFFNLKFYRSIVPI